MIVKNIIKTLLNNDEVCLNGLGHFTKTRKASTIEDGKINPPAIIICFHYDEDCSGFPFVMNVSQWEQIRIVESDSMINQWVADLLNGIDHNKSVTFDNFGTFYKNDLGKVVFESDIIKELNIDFEGMKSIVIPTISSKNNDAPITTSEPTPAIPEIVITKTEQVDSETETKIEESTPSTIESETLIPQTDQIDTKPIADNKKRIKTWEISLFIFVILLVMAILAALFKDELLSFYNAQKTPTPTEVIAEKNDDTPSIVTQQDLPEEISAEENIPTENVTSSNDNVSVTTNQPSIENNKTTYLQYVKGNYYVIAGSFIKESDALKHIAEKHKEIGKYDVKLIKQEGNNRIRICIASFSTEAEANKLVAETGNKYWVLQ